MQKPVPGQQRILGIVAFEVVHRVEEILPAGLTLAPREGAKCVEPARDRRDEPAFAAAVSRDRTKDGRLRLVGPIGATEPLHGPIGAPARLKQKMNATMLILVIEDPMLGSARSSRVHRTSAGEGKSV